MEDTLLRLDEALRFDHTVAGLVHFLHCSGSKSAMLHAATAAGGVEIKARRGAEKGTCGYAGWEVLNLTFTYGLEPTVVIDTPWRAYISSTNERGIRNRLASW